MNAGVFNTYYYTTNDPYISYGSTHRFTKMLPVSQASMGRLPLETTIQANENRYITLVATHLGQTSWRPENNEKDSLEEIISTDIKFYNEGQSDTLLQTTDEENQLEINIYPNPFDHQLTVENPYEEVVLELTTLDGKHIKDYHIRKGVQKIATQNIPKGFYMIKISHQQRIFINSKFLKL